MARAATNELTAGRRKKPLSGQDKIERHRLTPRPKRGQPREKVSGRDSVAKGRGSRYWVSGYKHLVQEWHPTKNGDLTPDQVSFGSGKRIWWMCEKGPDHEWQQAPSMRIGAGRGCPLCAHQRESVTNCLATVAPKIAKEWHPVRNRKLTPRDVTAGAARKIWWKCPKGHSYQQTASRRVFEGHGCPVCAGYAVRRDNSLATLYPEVAKQWHPTKNGKLKPSEIVPGSTQKVWRTCDKGRDHIWHAMVRARTKMGHTCPCCAGRKPSVSNRLDTKHRKLSKEWHPTKNGDLKPREMVEGTKRFVCWRCSKNPKHEWKARLVDRTKRGIGCPHCRSRKS